MKSGLLRKLLFFLLLALIVNALLTASVFTFTSRNVFANIKAEEMIPRAERISRLWSQLLRGEIVQRDFSLFTDMVLDRSMWDASVHVYLGGDYENWLVHENYQTDIGALHILPAFLPDLLENRVSQVRTVVDELGIVIGYPIYGVDAEVVGVVFLTKPLNEVNAALNGLNMALLISSVIIFLFMIVPSYFGSRNLSRPLMQMSLAAQAMAKGDFSIRADVHARDEIGQLGQSLNELSEALSSTIGDLVIERNRLKSVLDGLSEGILAVDMQGETTHCNPASLRLLDADHAADAAQKLRDIFPEGLCVVQDPQDSSDAAAPEARMAAANGLRLRLLSSAIHDNDGLHAGIVTMIQDVTEQERLEQTRRDYVANVSHELRTPIASIRSLADALHDGLVKKEEDRQRYYGYILRESMRLSRLINDLLELSRLQSAGTGLDKHVFLLNDMLRLLGERFAEMAGDSGLQFQLDMPEEDIAVCSNEDRVEQVLVALLDNAVKYAADEGNIALRVQKETAHALVCVSNSGEIDKADMPHLFERFYKADHAHAGQGTGLGLAIAWEIMLLLKEKIWVENRDGEVCFLFTLQYAT